MIFANMAQSPYTNVRLLLQFILCGIVLVSKCVGQFDAIGLRFPLGQTLNLSRYEGLDWVADKMFNLAHLAA